MALARSRLVRELLVAFFVLLQACRGASGDDEPSADVYPKGQCAWSRTNVLLEWWLPVGCDFSGFFVEMLGYLVPMMRAVEKVSLHLGQCTNETLALMTDQEAAMLRLAQANYLEKDRVVTTQTQQDLARTVLVQHATPCEWQHFSEVRPKVVIGRTMTERLGVVEEWVECCERVDEVWVPTRWAADVFVASGVPQHKLHVMPEGVDLQLFKPKRQTRRALQRQRGARARPFVFLSVFKWETRKGMDLLLDAYWAAFNRNDNVVLQLRTYVPEWEVQRNVTKELDRQAAKSSPRRLRLWRKGRSPDVEMPKTLSGLAKVEIVGGGVNSEEGALSRAQMRDMYAEADSFVLPTRGEGWGLPVVEAMAMALPVIVTNSSGPASYMTEENAYPIRCGVPRRFKASKRSGGKSVPIGGYMEPSLEHLKELMVRVSTNPAEARAKGLRARQDIEATLSSEVVSERMLSRMVQLLEISSSAASS